MTFSLRVEGHTPLTPVKDLDQVAVSFLKRIGYIPKGFGPGTSNDEVQDSIPYRLFVECFLGNPSKGWFADELASELETTKPTIYRHLNKLKSLDLLEETPVEDKVSGKFRKAYRIRYGDLSKAWHFVEAHFEVAMANYRESVDHLQDLVKKNRKKARKRPKRTSKKKPQKRGKSK